MATTVTPQSLVVTISEAITLNNQAINSENQLTISNVSQIDKRLVLVPLTEITVMSFGAANAAGTFIAANLKYIRLTNKDDTNYVRIRVSRAGADTFDIKLDAGKSFVMGNTSESVSATAAGFSAFVDATSISAQANTAAVEIEYFVATIS